MSVHPAQYKGVSRNHVCEEVGCAFMFCNDSMSFWAEILSLLPPPMSRVPLSSDQPPQPSHQITVLAQSLYLSYITDYSTRTGSLPLLHYRSQFSHRVFTSPLRHIPRNMAPDKQHDLPPTTSRPSLRVPRLVLIVSSPLLVHRSGARSGRVSCRAPTGWDHRHSSASSTSRHG